MHFTLLPKELIGRKVLISRDYLSRSGHREFYLVWLRRTGGRGASHTEKFGIIHMEPRSNKNVNQCAPLVSGLFKTPLGYYVCYQGFSYRKSVG